MKFEVYTDIEDYIENELKFDVVDISVDTGTYIANGILTHNKIACDTSRPPGTGTPENHIIYVTYGYGTANLPITAVVSTTIVTQDCEAAYWSVKDPATGNETGNPAYGGNTLYITMPTPNPTTGISSYNVQFVEYNTSVFQSTTTQMNMILNAYDAGGLRDSSNTATKLTRRRISSCLVPETLIEKFNGECVYLKDIEVGDELLSIDFSKMQYIKSIVTKKSVQKVEALYKINDGMLLASKDHRHIVNRKDEWLEIKSEDLQIGDTYVTKDFQPMKILKIEILK